MKKGKGASIMEYFGALEDPRIDRCKLAGHRRHSHLRRHLSWVYVEMFGKSKEEWSAPSWICPTESRRRFSRLDPPVQSASWSGARRFAGR